MTALELTRFAIYVDLGVAFGVPAATILTRAQFGLERLRSAMAGAAILGVPLSLLGYLLTVAEMAGTGLRGLDWQLASELATGTAFGRAFLVRELALGAAGLVSLRRACGPPWLVVPSAVALGTLAWAGHAAADEGDLALLRLALDIAHLFAASIWVGALVLFLAMLRTPGMTPDLSGSALTRFAGIGSILVVTLCVTGLANLWFLTAPRTWLDLAGTGYGLLLATKLALFFGMLGLAGINRFVLAPHLLAGTHNQAGSAVRPLRLSIAIEFVVGLVILAIVSRLGLLDPGAK